MRRLPGGCALRSSWPRPVAAAPRRAAVRRNPYAIAAAGRASPRGGNDALPRLQSDEAPPPPATQDADQIHKLMQKKIAQLTKVVYHVNTTNEDHQSELAALKKQHREELARVSRDAAKRVKEIGDAASANDGGLKKKLENLISAHARDKANAQTKARECVNQALQKAHASHETEMNALRKVVKDLEERFRSAQNVFDATVEKLEKRLEQKSEQLEKELMRLQNQLDEKDSQ